MANKPLQPEQEPLVKNILTTIVDYIDQPLFIHDDKHQIIFANKAYLSGAKVEPEELRQRRYYEIYPCSKHPLKSCVSEGAKESEQLEEIVVGENQKIISLAYSAKNRFDVYQYSIHLLHEFSHDLTQAQRLRLISLMEQTIKPIFSFFIKTDSFTFRHQWQVSKLAKSIALDLGLNEQLIRSVNIAGALMDIGEYAVSEDILMSKDKLSDIEFSMIKSHPEKGYDILKNIHFPYPIANIVLQHHERLDGSGYPYGLTDEDILPEAKILAVADTVSAMSAARPYRPAFGVDVALETIVRQKGKKFDPEVVTSCLRVFGEGYFKFQAEHFDDYS